MADKAKYSQEQLMILENHFSKNFYLDHDSCERLAQQIGVTVKQLRIWYQNKRAKIRRFKRKMNLPDNNLTVPHDIKRWSSSSSVASAGSRSPSPYANNNYPSPSVESWHDNFPTEIQPRQHQKQQDYYHNLQQQQQHHHYYHHHYQLQTHQQQQLPYGEHFLEHHDNFPKHDFVNPSLNEYRPYKEHTLSVPEIVVSNQSELSYPPITEKRTSTDHANYHAKASRTTSHDSVTSIILDMEQENRSPNQSAFNPVVNALVSYLSVD